MSIQFTLDDSQLEVVLNALQMQPSGLASNTREELLRQRNAPKIQEPGDTFKVVDADGTGMLHTGRSILVEEHALFIQNTAGEVVATYGPGMWRSAQLQPKEVSPDEPATDERPQR
jgi:hypothetical protein